MSRVGWESLRRERPELKLPAWEFFPVHMQRDLLDITPEQVVTTATSTVLQGERVHWGLLVAGLSLWKDCV